MNDLTPETVAALRGRAGVAERLALSREQVLALLDAADERDRIKAELGDPSRHCIMGGRLVIDTRQHNCGTGPGGHYGAHEPGDERDTLAAAVERVRALHSPGIVYLHADECVHGDGDGHTVIEGLDGDLLCFDSPTGDRFCTECAGAWDELPAWPCPTIRALDGTGEDRLGPHPDEEELTRLVEALAGAGRPAPDLDGFDPDRNAHAFLREVTPWDDVNPTI